MSVTLLLIGGLSGAGKSSLGHYLSHHGFQWLELDGGFEPNRRIDEARLRAEWDALLHGGNSVPFRRRYPGATVVTVASTVQFEEWLDAGQVRVRYLVGDPAACLDGAQGRDRRVDREHWHKFNDGLLRYLDADCPENFKIRAWDERGGRRTHREIAAEILE